MRPVTESPVADVAIIGAGVVGAAIARTLARYQLNCVLIDAADDVGTGTTKANTAILHTGFDAPPGSLEAHLLRRGSACCTTTRGWSASRWNGPGRCSSRGTARSRPPCPASRPRRGATAIRRSAGVGLAELYRREPHLGPGALGALDIPDESIICPWTTPLAYATEAARAGVRLLLGHRVTGVTAGEGWYELALSAPAVSGLRFRWAVNAAGLHSDLVDRMFGLDGFAIPAPAR